MILFLDPESISTHVFLATLLVYLAGLLHNLQMIHTNFLKISLSFYPHHIKRDPEMIRAPEGMNAKAMQVSSATIFCKVSMSIAFTATLGNRKGAA